MTEFKDFFISYGRRESLGFAARLHRELKLAGCDAWFDKVNIPDGDDYAERISHGIESAHNFLIVMAPRCMTSPYCLIELEYARILGKRVIPVNQMVIFDTPEQALSEGDRQVLVNFYKHHGVPDPDIRSTQDVLNRCHFLIGATDWLDAKENLTDADCNALMEWARPYENFWHRHDDPEYLRTLDPEIMCFGERIDELAGVVERVVTVTERHGEFVHTHTELLAGALRWHKNQRAGRFLLTGKKRRAAEAWLLTEFRPPNQPPCKPSDLHCDFICESRKNAENMMTDVFICYDAKDRRIRDQVIRSLSKYAVTAWTHDKDILKGADYERAIHNGIENADNFFYFISPGSVSSEYCRKELEHARQYNKRLVPLLIEETPQTEVPEALRGLQYTDFTDNECQDDYDRDIDDILRILDHDSAYYKDHKILLSRALKWDAEDRKPSFLLRGYNLENAQTWLRLNNERADHPPLELHRELIAASEAARGQLSTDVFISYSRKDGDFARKLNMALQEAGKTTWFDQESISKGVDFEKAIFDGIEKSDNFLFVLSPDAVESEYCEGEVNYAVSLSKRFITVLNREIDPGTMPGAMRKINWIDFKDAPFDKAFPELIQAIELDREHARMHTVLQQRATEWMVNDRGEEFLMNTTACGQAETWLAQAEADEKQPAPTPVQRDFITASRASIAAAERAAAKRRRVVMGSLTAGLFIAVMLTVFAVFQWKEAETQEKIAKQEKLNVRKILVKNYRISALGEAGKNNWLKGLHYFARSAEQELNEQSVKNRIFEIQSHLLPLHAVIEPEKSFLSAVFNKKQNILLTWSNNGTAQLWDAATGLPVGRPMKHGKAVTGAMFSPAGTRILTWSKDKTARLWDAANGDRIGALMKHKRSVDAAIFSNDETRILSWGRNGTMRLWDAATGSPAGRPMKHRKRIFGAAFNKTATRILTWSQDKTACLWDASDGSMIGQPMKHGRAVFGAAFNRDETRILTWSEDKTVRLWNAADGSQIGPPMKHGRAVFGAAFNQDETRILTWSNDGTANMWNVEDGSRIGQPIKHDKAVKSARFNRDETRILTRSDDGTARLWDAADGSRIGQSMKHDGAVYGAVFNKNETHILTWSKDGTVNVWDASDGSRIGRPFKHDRAVRNAAFNNDETRILTRCDDGGVRLWNIADGSLIGQPMKHDESVIGAAFNHDETRILSWGEDGTIRLWDVSDGSLCKLAMRHKAGVYGAAFNRDETRILIWSGDFGPGTAQLWDATTGSPAGQPMKHTDTIIGAAFNPQGTRILTWSDDGTARLWDAADGSMIGQPMKHEKTVKNAVFSPEGDRILTWSDDGTVRFWDAASGSPLKSIKSVDGATLNPKSTRILTWRGNGTAQLLDAATGASSRQPMIHEETVSGGVISGDGGGILTWSENRNAWLWNAAGEAWTMHPVKHGGTISGAAFNTEGDRLLTWSDNGTARLWNAADGSPVGQPMEHDGAILGGRFNFRSTRILTCSSDKTARLWDAADCSPIGQPMKHEEAVDGAVFYRNDTGILTWSKDGSARLWDVVDGLPVGQPMRHEGDVIGAAFNANETRILTWSADGTARLWDVRADYDFPQEHLPLLVEAATGTIMDEYGNLQILDKAAWEAKRDTYIGIAESHLENCKYQPANFYLIRQKQFYEKHRSVREDQPSPSTDQKKKTEKTSNG